MSSCEGCLAARMDEMAAYEQAIKSAKERANEKQIPIFILKTTDGYTISESLEANAVEAVLPDDKKV